MHPLFSQWQKIHAQPEKYYPQGPPLSQRSLSNKGPQTANGVNDDSFCHNVLRSTEVLIFGKLSLSQEKPLNNLMSSICIVPTENLKQCQWEKKSCAHSFKTFKLKKMKQNMKKNTKSFVSKYAVSAMLCCL